MFVWMISSEPQNILSPNLVWLCSIMIQIVVQKNWFSIFNVKVTARAYIIQIWLFVLYLLNCWLQPNLIWYYSITSQSVQWKNWITAFKVKVTAKVQNVSECLSGWYLLNTYHFVIRLGMFMQDHKPECHAEKVVHSLQCQGHSKGLYNQIWSFLLYLLSCWSVCNQTWFW